MLFTDLVPLNGTSSSYKDALLDIEDTFTSAEAYFNKQIQLRSEDEFYTIEILEDNDKVICLWVQCKILCSAKLYYLTEFESDGEAKRSKRMRLQTQMSTIEAFWNYILKLLTEFIYNCAGKLVNSAKFTKLIECIGVELDSNDAKQEELIFNEMQFHFEIFSNSLKLIDALLSYISLHYPQVTKKVLQNRSTETYSINIYFEFLREQLPEKFELVKVYHLKRVFLDVAEHEEQLDSNAPYEYKLLKKLYTSNVKIGTTNYRDFYFQAINQIGSTLLKDSKQDGRQFFELVKSFSKGIIMTSWYLDSDLVNQAIEVFYDSLYLTSNSISTVLTTYLMKNITSIDLSKPSPVLGEFRGHLKSMVLAFKTRDNVSQLIEIIKSFTRKSLQYFKKNEVRNDFTDFLKVIIAIIYLLGFIELPNDIFENTPIQSLNKLQFNVFTQAASDEFLLFIGGYFKMIDLYQRSCDFKLKGLEFKNTKMNSNEIEDVLCIAPYCLKFIGEFIKLHGKYLFRKLVMSGPEGLDFFNNPFRTKLYSIIRDNVGDEKKDFDLTLFLNEINMCCQRALSFQNYHLVNDKIKVVPLVFDRNKIPAEFLETSNDEIVLPSEFKKIWNSFAEFYGKEKKSEYKKLQPLYSLHHCEVSTPYQLPNKMFLTLELTLNQTLVLNAMNDNDTVSISDLADIIGLKVAVTELTVRSFTDIGLLTKINNDTIKVNENFVPDVSKLKSNKLRVALPKPNMSSTKKTSMPNSKTKVDAQWKLEVLKSAIVRTLKSHKTSCNYDELLQLVKGHLLGFSMGEFTEALKKSVADGALKQQDDLFQY